MHSERYRVPDATMAACEAAERVVAIGTTTVRALESAAETGRLEGRTDLFIHGERPFAMVDALLTNFHLPRSSLLVLVDALIGPRWRRLYDEAPAHGYRFLSFADAMFLPGGPGACRCRPSSRTFRARIAPDLPAPPGGRAAPHSSLPFDPPA